MEEHNPQQRILALVQEAMNIADAAKLNDLALHLDRVIVELGAAEPIDLDDIDRRSAA